MSGDRRQLPAFHGFPTWRCACGKIRTALAPAWLGLGGRTPPTPPSPRLALLARPIGGRQGGRDDFKIFFRANSLRRQEASKPSTHSLLISHPLLTELLLQLFFLSPDKQIHQGEVDGGKDQCGG